LAQAKKQPKYQQGHALTPEQSALVEKAMAREKILIKNIQQRTPLVETYIQNIRPDLKLYQVPVQDQYMLSRIDFGKGFFDKAYQPRTAASHGYFKGSLAALSGLSKALRLDRHFTYNPLGFTEMMFLDPSSFDSQHYAFSYVRREFLGSVRTWVYDVHPKVAGSGRFYGRIWVEDQEGNVVRFNGTFTHRDMEDDSRLFFHFDSWRMNVQPGIWLPVAVYVEETERIEGEKSVGLKAQTHFWGYSLKLPTRESENVSVKVDDAVDKSEDAQDVGPLQATRNWVTQAENNVIDRLVEAGLVAPLSPGGYENTVLDQIVINLAVPNNLAFTDPVHCRILLTTTVEATTVGNTILLSKGLIDALPLRGGHRLGRIARTGPHCHGPSHRHPLRLQRPPAVSRRVDLPAHQHVPLGCRQLRCRQKSAGISPSLDVQGQAAQRCLFWTQLADRGKALKALNSPRLGDSLLKADDTPWMAELGHSAPRLNWDDMAQTAALPLDSWLKTDPWDDKVHMLNAKRYAPMNARDKMPFEVTPVFYKLQRYDTTHSEPSTSSAAPAAPTVAGGQSAAAADTPLPAPEAPPPPNADALSASPNRQ
jgi:hypothetical protein